jgi:hypothetical protein
VLRLLVTANVAPSLHIFVTLKMETISSSETSVLTRATRRNVPDGAILLIRIRGYKKLHFHGNSRGILKSIRTSE